MRFTTLCCLLYSLSITAVPAQDEQRVQRCQKLKTAIENYSEKRRAGGSVSQMDSWNRARREKKNEWHKLKCRHLKRQLK